MSRLLLLITFLFVLTTCNFIEEDVFKTPPTPEFTFTDATDRINLNAALVDDQFSYAWTANAPLSFGQYSSRQNSYFKIPVGSAGGNTEVSLTLSHKKRHRSVTVTIDVPPYSIERAYGLGKSLIAGKSNDAAYEWYVDQNVGTYPLVDCGPTSTTMAIKWYDQNFLGTPIEARAFARSDGGWWYTTDIVNYLYYRNTPSYIISFTTEDDLKAQIDNGNIAILCLDMYYISGPQMEDSYHYNKFYKTESTGWGHFIVIKGYKKVETIDGQTLTYMEAYDPYSLTRTYDDSSFKGKNRYYLLSDLVTSAHNWWPYAIVISKDGNAAGRMGLDLGDIPAQKGR
jgi:hypothetical protein